MKCSKCRLDAVVEQPYSGLALCTRHFLADVEAKAKKEIRKKGGLASAEKIFLKGADDYRLFALRIFVSSLFAKRTDIIFVRLADEATTVFSSETLDDVAANLLDAVLEGQTVRYLDPAPRRVIAPLSVIPASEVYLYATLHRFAGEFPPPTPTQTFLEEFSATRPGTKYAIKNTADSLEDLS